MNNLELVAYVLVIAGLVSMGIGLAATMAQYTNPRSGKFLRWARLLMILSILAILFGAIIMLSDWLQTITVLNGGRMSIPAQTPMSDWPVAAFFITGSVVMLFGLVVYSKAYEKSNSFFVLILGLVVILLGTMPAIQDLLSTF